MAESWDVGNVEREQESWNDYSRKKAPSPAKSWGDSPPSSQWGEDDSSHKIPQRNEERSTKKRSDSYNRPTQQSSSESYNRPTQQSSCKSNNRPTQQRSSESYNRPTQQSASESCDSTLDMAFKRANYSKTDARRGTNENSTRGNNENSRRGNNENYRRGRGGHRGSNNYRGDARGTGYSDRRSTNNDESETDQWGRKKKQPQHYDRGYSRPRGRNNYQNNNGYDSSRDKTRYYPTTTEDSDSDSKDWSLRGNKTQNKSNRGRNNRDQNQHFKQQSDSDNTHVRGYRGKNSNPHYEKKMQNGNPENRGPNKMSHKKIKQLLEIESHPDDMMLMLKAESSGFMQLLKDYELTAEMVADILTLLNKACQSNKKLNLLQLLGIVNDSNFLVRHIPDFLVELQLESEKKPELLDSLTHLVEFLSALPLYQPANSLKTLSKLIPQINSCMDTLVKYEADINFSILDDILELEKAHNGLIEKYRNEDMKKQAEVEKQHAVEPPESFYNLRIFPTQEELNSVEKPFLRCNISDGQYVNVTHYLDTQFRLMREDFVRPLREGIAEIKLKNTEFGKNSRKIQGLYQYQGVHILDPICALDGINHIVQFDNTNLKNVTWDNTKRFFPGSLVCLSSDEFQTMIFATVANRDPRLLQQGILHIHFEEKNDKVKKLTPNQTFVMIESSAFFEAYFYNLKAMQSLKEDSFPLKDYIVYVKKDLKTPKYLLDAGKPCYDIRPLMMPYPEKWPPSKDFFKEDKINANKDIYNFSPMHEYVSDIAILEKKQWPPAYELKLDESQLKALQLALTKEFVMIQGPPGTGKTFIGLRIVQLLLHNSHYWTGEDKAPILIVCFTNHALDQFLEGVLHFTHSMIRVGGRCTSEELQDYRIAAKRFELKKSGKMPPYIYRNKMQITRDMFSIQAKIDHADKTIQRSLQDIFTEEELVTVMSETHRESLLFRNRQSSTGNTDKLILDWLELRFSGNYDKEEMEDSSDEEEIQDLSKTPARHSSYAQATSQEKAPSKKEVSPIDDFFEDPLGTGVNDEQEFLKEIEEEYKKLHEENLKNEDLQSETSGKSQIQRKKRRKTLQKHLKGTDKKKTMDPETANGITNVWKIQIDQRWQLYCYWISNLVMQNYLDIYEYHEAYENKIKQLKELRIKEDAIIIKGCKILGMTTTGAAKNQQLLEELKPKIVIVEEAAEVSEGHIITAMNENTQHLILIGDHQQLRPSPASYSLAQEYGIDISLFERMVKNNVYCQQLVSQHRMRPCISDLLVPTIYKTLSNSPSVHQYEAVKGVAKNMYFVTHRYVEGQEVDSVSRINVHEASFVVKLAKYFVNQGYEQDKITILTTYSAQVFSITKLMLKEQLQKIDVKSVDNYQGEENDIILISFVRSNAQEVVGFLKISNRVCVALSRARKGLFCVGNFDMLASQSDLWKEIVKKLDDTNSIGSDLRLVCQNHPETFNDVRNPEDFDRTPEGGCTRACDYRLKCGHVCYRRCHPYDPKHLYIQCKEPCQKKTCKAGHYCRKKCFQCVESCGDCSELVLKELLCGHQNKIPCHENPEKAMCKMSCGKMLPCGHACSKMCHEPCDRECKMKITKTGACGHSIKIQCSKSNDRFELLKSCVVPCSTELICGHACKGNCGSCSQGSLHVPCDQPCNRSLVCGHQCKNPCSKACPPCEERCETQCSHSKCKKICGMPCDPCASKCEWQCPHKKCTTKCGEMCNRKRCPEPCPKTIKKCKHKCISFCGEPCPKLCLICDKDDVTDIYFGSEEDENCRFVQLPCGDIFESKGLDLTFSHELAKDNNIRMLRCLKCKRIIHECHWLGAYIKNACLKVEQVKEKVYGIKKENIRKLKHMKIQATNLFHNLEHMTEEFNFKAVMMHITSILSLGDLEMGKLAAMENYINFVQRINVIENNFWEASDDILNSTKVYSVTLKIHVRYLQNKIAMFMIDSCKSTPSLQQCQDLDKEINRLHFIMLLIISVHKAGGLRKLATSETASKHFKNGLAHLLAPKPMDEILWDKVQVFLTDMRRCLGLATLGITEEERKNIVKAVGLTQGHWYQCPNGHVYCIGECGGATELSRCNECGAKIGGTNHALQADNRVATEMDGAAVAAWSEASNLQNFQLNDAFLD